MHFIKDSRIQIPQSVSWSLAWIFYTEILFRVHAISLQGVDSFSEDGIRLCMCKVFHGTVFFTVYLESAGYVTGQPSIYDTYSFWYLPTSAGPLFSFVKTFRKRRDKEGHFFHLTERSSYFGPNFLWYGWKSAKWPNVQQSCSWRAASRRVTGRLAKRLTVLKCTLQL